MLEMRLVVTAQAEDRYRFKVRTALGAYEIDYAFTSGWRAQLQRLHWKAGNLLSEDDSFLKEVSSALKNAIFTDSQRPFWEPALAAGISNFIVQFGPNSRSAALLPFELISIDEDYLVDRPGFRIVREIADGEDRTGRSTSERNSLRLLHVSLGTDSVLELARERAMLLNELPGVRILFLISPTQSLLRAETQRFQPTVVHVSSHGSFELLNEQHGIFYDDGDNVPTGALLKLMANSNVRSVFLASCQSALFAAGDDEFGKVTNTIEVGLAMISALGGGVAHDILIQHGPPMALLDVLYLLVALAGGLVGFLARLPTGSPLGKLLLVVDAAALGSSPLPARHAPSMPDYPFSPPSPHRFPCEQNISERHPVDLRAMGKKQLHEFHSPELDRLSEGSIQYLWASFVPGKQQDQAMKPVFHRDLKWRLFAFFRN
jgi:hypothetical protein